MALTKLSGVINVASGKMNGVVYSRNRNGTYVRVLAVPVNPRSPKQTAVRQQLAIHAAAYRALSEGQRADWVNLGTQITRRNRVGDTYNLTGSQAYVSINQLRATAGQPPVNDAPSPDALGNILTASTSGIASDGPTDRALTFTATYSGNVAGKQVRVYAAPPLSAGKAFIRPTQYRLLATLPAVNGTAQSILAAYEATFGNLSESKEGALVSIQLVPYDAEGFNGTPLRVDTILSVA